MKYIVLWLAGREIGRAYPDRFVDMLPENPFGVSAKKFYDDSFYSIANSSTFEERFQRVTEGNYMCFSKPALRLYAFETGD